MYVVGSRYQRTGEDTNDCADYMLAAVNCRLYETDIAVEVLVGASGVMAQ
jgi:hypothetical protein